MHKDPNTQSAHRIRRDSGAARSRRAFTLVEVLISAVILAIGLVGLAAVFPAVISQQQSANDLTTAVSVSATADGVLATRLPLFRSRFNDPNVINALGTEWHRISSVEADTGAVFYLQAPWQPPPDLRLREEATYDVPLFGFGSGHLEYPNIQLPRRPIAQDGNAGDLVVHVDYLDVNGMPQFFTLVPGANSQFVEGEGASGRLGAPQGPNSIDFIRAQLQFFFNMAPGERATRIVVEFRWLNDRIISHPDRLYPTDAPRYAWELAFRRSADGQLQYTTFIYRFDGLNAPFVPEIPGRWSIPNSEKAGMLRRAAASVSYNRVDDRYELQATANDMRSQLEAGSWLLPVEGTSAMRIRRSLGNESPPRFELDGPPMHVRPDGVAEPLVGNVEFWYMPTTIKAFSDQGQEIGVWRIKPLLATTRQVQL